MDLTLTQKLTGANYPLMECSTLMEKGSIYSLLGLGSHSLCCDKIIDWFQLPTDPCSKRTKSLTQYIFKSSSKKLKSSGFMKWICKKLVAIFSKQRQVMQARQHMTINHMIGMSQGEQEPMKSGRYHDIIHWDIIHHDVIHSAFTKMADSRNFQQKYTWLLPSIYTFFGFIFQKPFTCIRNNIVLHVYHNLKCNEKLVKSSVPCKLDWLANLYK